VQVMLVVQEGGSCLCGGRAPLPWTVLHVCTQSSISVSTDHALVSGRTLLHSECSAQQRQAATKAHLVGPWHAVPVHLGTVSES
jgi:hypothetical protein